MKYDIFYQYYFNKWGKILNKRNIRLKKFNKNFPSVLEFSYFNKCLRGIIFLIILIYKHHPVDLEFPNFYIGVLRIKYT